MRTARVIAALLAASLAGGLLSTVAIARGARRSPDVPHLPAWSEGLPISRELAAQGVVWHGNDLGTGERVLLVLGGAFGSRQEAEQANATIGLGDVHGYYVAATDQFEGLRDHVGSEGADFVLVSAFRTAEGAADYMAVARANDAPAVLTPRLVNRGYEYVGLGQEPHPNGQGPLIGPLAGVST